MRCAIWNRWGWGVIAGLWLSTCGGPTGLLAEEKGGGKSQVKQSELIVGQPVRYKNLTIFPVTSKVAKNQDRFITLDEALKAGTVEVSEVGADRPARPHAAANQSGNRAGSRPPARTARNAPPPSANQQAASTAEEDPFAEGGTNAAADVNRLVLSNNSNRPLYLMPGEILVGGQQDRTLAQEVIVPPKTKHMAINVFCVEHGRWAGRDDMANSIVMGAVSEPQAMGLDVRRAAKSAKSGKFPLSAGSLDKGGRLAVQEGKGQGEVWDEVATTNRRSGAADFDSLSSLISSTVAPDTFSQIGATGAFTANYVSPQVTEKLKPYLKSFEQPIANTQRVVGVIMAVNGKVEAADVFESTPLFRKLWPKLLKSYALDAVAAPASKDQKPCQMAQAEVFLNDAMQAKVEEVKTENGLVATRRVSKGVASFSVSEKREGGAGTGMGGGFGGGVHGAAFGK